ncbi:MAG TPA: cytochrome c-type biogenesis CcmF C-terminal domain-containing protein, partial [Pyrinomonadaceae bacterium]|nr:cytochrome c-type biogenesis CcmF C-terminal domain-containing protein [Pyrinomonadaceae bacterium]
IVTGYQLEQDTSMRNGDVVRAAGYEFKLNNVTDVTGPNYVAARAEIIVSRNGVETERMYPEKRNYTASGNVMTETAIDSGLFRDLYVSLGEQIGSGAWSVRVYYKPFVGWIWAGALLMALGGGLAVSDRRYALAARKELEARETVKAKEVPATVAAQTETV